MGGSVDTSLAVQKSDVVGVYILKTVSECREESEKARGSKRKKDLESVKQNCKIKKHTPCKCLCPNLSALRHSPIQNSDAYAAAECIPSSDSRFSHCSELRM